MISSKLSDAFTQIFGPKNTCVTQGYGGQAELGVAAFQWDIPRDVSGGDHEIRVTNKQWDMYLPSATRKIQIRAFRNPKIQVKLDYLGSGYGPGDKVNALVHVSTVLGGTLPAGTSVICSASLDGQPLFPQPINCELDSSGECSVEFDLPTHMTEGVGTLTAVVSHLGEVESGSKTIPIILQVH